MSQPEVHDLYCGLGGWAEGFISEGYKAIGYDIEKHDYGNGSYPGELVICDVLELHGSRLKNALIIVASPPCQEPSYRAMPWSRAKALNAIGPPHKFIALFEACFRIQREASEAAGHYIPIVLENVKGAQRWVGKAQAHFGSFYLWGDIGQVGRRIVVRHGRLKFGDGLVPRSRVSKVPGFRFDGNGASFQTASVKKSGQNWSRFKETGEVSPHWRMQKNDGGSWFGVAHNTGSGKNNNPVSAKLRQDQRDDNGVKGFTPNGEQLGKNTLGRKFGSKSPQRKAASAEIAKIPFPLASWIAKCYYPVGAEFRP